MAVSGLGWKPWRPREPTPRGGDHPSATAAAGPRSGTRRGRHWPGVGQPDWPLAGWTARWTRCLPRRASCRRRPARRVQGWRLAPGPRPAPRPVPRCNWLIARAESRPRSVVTDGDAEPSVGQRQVVPVALGVETGAERPAPNHDRKPGEGGGPGRQALAETGGGVVHAVVDGCVLQEVDDPSAIVGRLERSRREIPGSCTPIGVTTPSAERTTTQSDLARLLDVSPSAISQAESGRRGLSLDTVILLSERLGVSLDDLFSTALESGYVPARGPRVPTPTVSALLDDPQAGLRTYLVRLGPGRRAGRTSPTRAPSSCWWPPVWCR